MPDLSVLIVSYNTRALLDACLHALQATVRTSYEVIVVDNASHDGSSEMLRTRWPEVRVFAMRDNLGFARAVNLALANASGQYLLLLNPDTRVLPEALDQLVAFLAEHPNAGVAAPQLLNADLTDQGTARAFPTPWATIFGRKSLLTRLFPHNRWSRRYMVGKQLKGAHPFVVDWVSGACMMVRRDVLGNVGPLDEHFFMYWEDADWCRRIGAAGYAVYCVPGAQVIHYEGQSSAGRPSRLIWTFHRSVYRYYTKHHLTPRWHPLRPFVAVGLTFRAAAIIATNAPLVTRTRSR